MTIIDKGEKHLFKKRLLDSSGNLIDQNKVINVIFELYKANNTIFQTWSKTEGDVKWAGEYAAFEFDSQSAPEGFYFTKVTLVVRDDRWIGGESRDVSWCDERINILSGISPTNNSVSEEGIQFDVVLSEITSAPETAPTQTAFAESHSTATTSRIFWSSVENAARYEYEVESNPGVYVDAGNSTQGTITNLTANSTDRWRVRAVNNVDPGPWSDYQSYTTNPDTNISVSPSVNRDVVTFTIPNPDGLDVEINNSGSWTNEGNVTQIVVSGLPEGDELSSMFRFSNDGGPGPETTVTYQTTQRPQQAPTITDTDPKPGFNTININLIQDIDSVEYRLDAGTPVDVGLTSQFNVTASEGTYNLEVRYTNEWGGGEWSPVESISILESTPPTVSDSSLSATVSGDLVTVTYQKATDNKNDADLKYFLVTGSNAELTEKDLITGLTKLSSGTDTSQLQFNGNYGIGYDINVYTEDLAGNISLYTPIFVDIPNPEVQSIEVFNGSENVTQGIDMNSGQVLPLDIIVSVIDSENANYTTSINDTSLVTIDSNDVLTASNNSGDAILTITADLDSTQIQVPITVFAEELANDSTLIEITA